MKKYRNVLIGMAYGMLPVLLALVLIWNLGALASVVCAALGVQKGVALQVSQALQQLQEAKILMPWIAGLLLGLLSSCLLLVVKNRKGIIALMIVGALLLLPLTLGAFCLAEINDVQLWRELLALAQWL